MARSFPRSVFIGYDLADDALERARAEAAEAGATNAAFERCDIAELDTAEPFDAELTFDTIHDLADPTGTLSAAHRALKPGGTFLMSEPTVSSRLEENIGNPLAPWLYGVSTLHCLTVSLAGAGAGLGAAFGEQRARQLLDDAGFDQIEIHQVAGDPLDKVYVARRP